MKYDKALGVAAFLAATLCAPALADPAMPVDAAMRTLHEAYAKGDCTSALPLARKTRKASPKPMGEDWAWLNSIIVACDAKTDGDTARMYEDALAATASEPSSVYVWHARFRYEAMQKQYGAALISLEAMAASHAPALNTLQISWIFSLYQEMETANDDADELRLLKLVSAAYKPAEPFADMERLRLLYARKLYDQGQTAAAGDLVNTIQTFSGLVKISLDPDLRALQNPKVDLRVAAERQYVEDGIKSSEHPESLDGVIDLSTDLRRLGRYDDALAELESVRSRIGNAKAFADGYFQIPRWWEWRADIYVMRGDYDHVAESYRSAMAASQPGQPNINQILDFALEQVRFGRYEDALATLATAPSDPKARSPYGAMVFHFAHACAATLAGHKQDAAEDVAYTVAHEKDAPLDLVGALLCTDDMDGAAAVVIRMLANPEHRPGMLQALSDFLPPPPNVPQLPVEKLLPQIKARADVQAAISKAGGTLSFPFREDDL